jgi:RNA polymerase sigma factor (TIGR02999 family)
MRHILVDHARRQQAERRGGGAVQVNLDERLLPADDGLSDVLGVDEAIEQLAERNGRMAQVVELRFFGGLSSTEVADVLQSSVRTVEREWTRAKAYLLEALSDDESG